MEPLERINAGQKPTICKSNTTTTTMQKDKIPFPIQLGSYKTSPKKKKKMKSTEGWKLSLEQLRGMMIVYRKT